MLPTLTDAETLHGHMHKDRKTPSVTSIPKAASINPDIYGFSITSHAVPRPELIWMQSGHEKMSKIWFAAHFSTEKKHTISIPIPAASWFGRGWAKGRGVVNHLFFQVINSTRVAILHELAKLKMSILHTCTEKKVLLLYMVHGLYTKTLFLI